MRAVLVLALLVVGAGCGEESSQPQSSPQPTPAVEPATEAPIPQPSSPPTSPAAEPQATPGVEEVMDSFYQPEVTPRDFIMARKAVDAFYERILERAVLTLEHNRGKKPWEMEPSIEAVQQSIRIIGDLSAYAQRSALKQRAVDELYAYLTEIFWPTYQTDIVPLGFPPQLTENAMHRTLAEEALHSFGYLQPWRVASELRGYAETADTWANARQEYHRVMMLMRVLYNMYDIESGRNILRRVAADDEISERLVGFYDHLFMPHEQSTTTPQPPDPSASPTSDRFIRH